jgi:uncharacterized membrane protein
MIWLLVLGIGAVAGLRSLTPLAVVSWAARLGWIDLGGTPLWFLDTRLAAIALTVLAAGELVGDKLPFTPSRLSPGPLGARLVSGALCGAALILADGGSALPGAIVGGVGGLLGSYAGYHARHALVARAGLPDLAVALSEDLVTLSSAIAIVALT